MDVPKMFAFLLTSGLLLAIGFTFMLSFYEKKNRDAR